MPAGSSAQREYEWRHHRDREHRRASFKWTLVVVLLAGPVVYGLVRLGTVLANDAIASWSAGHGVEEPTETIPPSTANLLGLVLGGAAMLTLAQDAWAPRRTTTAWRTGAAGERATASQLNRLPGSFVVLHDLRLPRSAANLDHLVVGPTGVFTVETKKYGSAVKIRRGEARRDGRSLEPVVEQALRQSAAVEAALGCDVRPIVCVQGAGVTVDGWFQKPIVDGVTFCSGSRLPKLLREGGSVLHPDGVEHFVVTARRALRPAVHPSIETTTDRLLVRRDARRATTSTRWSALPRLQPIPGVPANAPGLSLRPGRRAPTVRCRIFRSWDPVPSDTGCSAPTPVRC